MNKEDLSLPNQLSPNRRGHLLLAIATDESEDRVTLFRRGGKGGHLSNTGNRHLQGSWNWGSAHRQNIDVVL